MVSLLWLEGRKSIEESKEDDSYGPNIDAKCIASPIKDFRGYVVGRSTNSPLVFMLELELGCEAEVSNFDDKLVVEKDVGKFQIPVDVLFGMEIGNSIAYSV